MSEPSSSENDPPTSNRWPTDEASRVKRIEAILVMARKPLTARKISDLAELEDGTEARSLIKKLNQHYDEHRRAFHVKRVAGGYQLRTRPQFAPWIRKLKFVPQPTKLSTPALETLTVVAYRQPIIKADIEAIRGVSCGEMLRQLLERGLIKIAGRSEALGRPYLYATSKDFLATFGFNSLDDLPRSDQLSGKGLPVWVEPDDNLQPNQSTKSTPLVESPQNDSTLPVNHSD